MPAVLSTPAAARETAKDFPGLVRHFVGTIAETAHGKLLLTIWGSSIVGSFFVAYWRSRQRRAERRARPAKGKAGEEAAAAAAIPMARTKTDSKEGKGAARGRRRNKWQHLRALLSVLLPSALSEEALSLVVYTVVLATRVTLTVKVASIVGRLGALMGRRNWAEMFTTQAYFSLLCFPAAASNALMKWFEKRISLLFRGRLTRRLHALYLSSAMPGGDPGAKAITFYHLLSERGGVENLDQRLTADVDLFCSSLTNTYGHLVKPLLDVAYLSLTLSRLMGPRQLAIFFLYFAATQSMLSAVKPSFSRMVSHRQELEGRFRAHHARVTAYPEEIAFLRGNDTERAVLDSSYDALASHESSSLFTHLWCDFIDSYVLKYGSLMCAYSAVIPSVYLGWKERTDMEATEHYITTSTLLGSLGGAVKDVALSYKQIASLRALAERVHDVKDRMDAHRREQVRQAEAGGGGGGGGGRVTQSGDEIVFDGVDIWTPGDDRRLLVAGLRLRVRAGEHLLLSGVNGTGKSSIFRVLGRLWRPASGALTLPADSERNIFFITQRPYMFPGTLRDQLTYPEQLPAGAALDARLEGLLRLVDLEGLLDRYSLDAVEDWSVLSGGEQQRLVLVRLFYHRPRYGVLDECTSAISAEMESEVFRHARRLGITLVTIAHNDWLRRHHTNELRLLGGGAWKLSAIAHDD